MPASVPFLDRPGRIVSTTITDDTLDRLDAIRAADPDLPSRAELIRHAVELYCDLTENPEAVMLQLVQGLKAIYGAGLDLETETGGTA